MRGLAVDGEQIAGADLETRPDDGVGIPFESSVVEHARAIYTRRVHRYTDQTEELAKAILSYTTQRLRMDPVPLDGPKSSAELTALAGQTITEDGMGGAAALKLFGDVLAPACISVDHPRFLSFIPAAPTEASMLFDLVCGASSIYGGSWLEGAGRGLRREPGAAVRRRPRRPAGAAPAASSSRAARRATCRRS